MKAQFKVSPKLIIELEEDTQDDLFKAIASATEVFGDKVCGLCGGVELTFAWRTAEDKKGDKHDYPELRCENSNCYAHLGFGKLNDKSGNLFPHRKLLPNGKSPGKDDPDKDKAVYGKHNGWTKYRGEKV